MQNELGAAGALPHPACGLPSNSVVKAYFLVSGPAEPGLVPRLADCVAKLGLVPLRLHASSEAGDGSELACDLRVEAVAPDEARRLEGLLRRVIGVRQVVAVVEPSA
jgi:hypothetical protein